MASGDFADLYGKAIRAARRDASYTQDVTDAKAAINEAMQAVCFSGDPWSFLEREGQFTVTPSADTYTLSAIGTALGTDVAEVYTLTIDSGDSGSVLEPVTWGALERMTGSTQDDEETGEPEVWAKWDSRIRFYPIPDDAYDVGIFYRAYQPEHTTDSQTSLIPLEWRTRLLVPYAASVLLRQEGGAEAGGEADRYYQLYLAAFREARTALATANEPTISLYGPGWDG